MKLLLPNYKIHRDGIGFFLFAAIAAGICMQFSVTIGLLLSLFALWCLYFFRVPTREPPSKNGVLVSAADGRVVAISEIVPPSEFGLGNAVRTRVDIFLNIFDVHINYIPIEGAIERVYYQEGHFFHAKKDKASEHNERNALVIKLPNQGYTVGVVQIAGLIARRIRCDVGIGDLVSTGQYYGLIRFGSRVEIYLPEGIEPAVRVGDRVKAARSVIANIG